MNKQIRRKDACGWLRYVAIFLLQILIFASLFIEGGCAQKEIPSEPTVPTKAVKEIPPESEIPPHYTTFTDETGLFSISYPQDWEPALFLIEGLEAAVKDVIASMEPGAKLEEAKIIFFVGVPTRDRYSPCTNIVVAPIPEGEFTHDLVTELQIREIKNLVQDYRELSRINTTISGIEATIVEQEGTIPELGKFHNLQMYMNVGNTAWCISCEPPEGEFSYWKEDFNNIVRSFRILKKT